MEFSGLIGNYHTKRPLTEQERGHRLKQTHRLNLNPRDQLCVVELNSTFLESVDKWFAWKGTISAVALILFAMFVGGLGGISAMWLLDAAAPTTTPEDSGFWLANGLGMGFVALCCGAVSTWLLRKECFAFTHYPIRFNRKTRMVHVFRKNGTVLSVSWDEVFFTLGHLAQWDEYEVRGHVLEADGITVRETFALSYLGSLSPEDAQLNRTQYSAEDYVRAHWEFVRRYMEDGPQAVVGLVKFCMPVNGRRERFRIGVERVFANIAGAPHVIFCMLVPFCVVVSLFRPIAMRTSKIPSWTTAVEGESTVNPNDPYAISGDANGDPVHVGGGPKTPISSTIARKTRMGPGLAKK